jgi:hypothetical protein
MHQQLLIIPSTKCCSRGGGGQPIFHVTKTNTGVTNVGIPDDLVAEATASSCISPSFDYKG